MLQETYTWINAILLAPSPLNHSAAGSGLKSLGHWLAWSQTLAKDRCVCVSDTELPVREILINAAHKDPSFLLPLIILWVNCSGAVIKIGFLAHLAHGFMDILLFLGQLYGLSGSSYHLCLETEIIFQNLSLCISTFLSESSDAEVSCKASINKMLQMEVVKNRDMQQAQQSLTEGPVCEVDEVYDKLEDRRKKAVAAKLGLNKVEQHDVGCHEESSDTGTEGVNSEAEVAKDNHQIMMDTRREDHLEKECEWSPDVAVMAAGNDIFTTTLLNVAITSS